MRPVLLLVVIYTVIALSEAQQHYLTRGPPAFLPAHTGEIESRHGTADDGSSEEDDNTDNSSSSEFNERAGVGAGSADSYKELDLQKYARELAALIKRDELQARLLKPKKNDVTKTGDSPKSAKAATATTAKASKSPKQKKSKTKAVLTKKSQGNSDQDDDGDEVDDESEARDGGHHHHHPPPHDHHHHHHGPPPHGHYYQHHGPPPPHHAQQHHGPPPPHHAQHHGPPPHAQEHHTHQIHGQPALKFEGFNKELTIHRPPTRTSVHVHRHVGAHKNDHVSELERQHLKYNIYKLKAKGRLARLQNRIERRKIMSLLMHHGIRYLEWIA